MKTKTYQTNIASKTIKGDYLSHQNVHLNWECCVTVSHCGEITSVNVHYIEGLDENDQPVEITEQLVDIIAELAADRALEQIERDDFIREDSERDV